MKSKLLKILLVLPFLLPFALRSQGIENILRHKSIQEIKARVAELEKQNRKSAGVLYLKAATSSDGKAALKLYEQVVLMYPKSSYADDAKFKISQYYYSIGFYNLAAEQFRELIWQYPNSPLRDGASYYMAQCFIAMERNEDAKRALRQFLSQFRRSSLVPLAASDLKKLEGEETASFPAKQQKKNDTPITTQDYSEGARKDNLKADKPNSAIYSIQVGAFLKQENAVRQRDYYATHGYQAEVLTKKMEGKYLYVVCVNRFSDFDAAVKFGKKLNQKYRVSFQVIQIDNLP